MGKSRVWQPICTRLRLWKSPTFNQTNLWLSKFQPVTTTFEAVSPMERKTGLGSSLGLIQATSIKANLAMISVTARASSDGLTAVNTSENGNEAFSTVMGP